MPPHLAIWAPLYEIQLGSKQCALPPAKVTVWRFFILIRLMTHLAQNYPGSHSSALAAHTSAELPVPLAVAMEPRLLLCSPGCSGLPGVSESPSCCSVSGCEQPMLVRFYNHVVVALFLYFEARSHIIQAGTELTTW